MQSHFLSFSLLTFVHTKPDVQLVTMVAATVFLSSNAVIDIVFFFCFLLPFATTAVSVPIPLYFGELTIT